MQPQSTSMLTRKEFFDIYWFSPLQMVMLINPKTTDYSFMVEMRHFVIRAGATEQMPGTVANVYLSNMTRILAQDENRMEFLSDFNLMKQYYDRLIVNVKNMMEESTAQPAYMKNVPASMQASSPEVPPWQQPDIAPVAEVKEPEIVTEKVKEFEQGGSKYKLVVDKNDNTVYYKDGRRTAEAEYAQAASLL